MRHFFLRSLGLYFVTLLFYFQIDYCTVLLDSVLFISGWLWLQFVCKFNFRFNQGLVIRLFPIRVLRKFNFYKSQIGLKNVLILLPGLSLFVFLPEDIHIWEIMSKSLTREISFILKLAEWSTASFNRKSFWIRATLLWLFLHLNYIYRFPQFKSLDSCGVLGFWGFGVLGLGFRV